MSSLPIKAIIKLVKEYLDIEIPELSEEKYYIQLLNLLREVKTQKKSELNLLTLIFEKMFEKENKFKSVIEEKAFNKFINLVNSKSFPIEEEKNNNDYMVIKKCLTNVKMINEKEIYLLFNLMNIEKSQLLFFKCFQEIISSKDKYFIENKVIELGNINYYTLLFYIQVLFQLKEGNNEEYYTFRINNKGLYKDKATNDEINKYVTEYKEIEKNEIVAFINKHKKLEKSMEPERNNNINMEVQQTKINPVNNDEKAFSNTKPNLEDEIMKLKKLFEDSNKDRYEINEKYDNIIKDLEKKNDKNINDIKKMHSKDINDINEKYDNIIKDMKEKHAKEINDINVKYSKEFKDMKEKHAKEINDINVKYSKEFKDIKAKHNKDINDLKIKHDQDLNNEKKKSDERTDKKINNLKEKIEELKKTINDIKVQNNSLLKKNESISKKNQILNDQLTSHQIESEENISNLNNKLNKSEEEKEKYQFENTLIKSRDSSKYIIDFLYTILYNKIDFTIKYETKVNIICEEIKKDACKNKKKFEFIKDLCKFLEKIYNDKVKGDKLTHDDEFKSHILDGNADLNNFFTNYLEIQKYFNYFKYLYFSNNINEENAEKILTICKGINFFNSLNDFSQRIN